MRVAVDPWDPSFGPSVELGELREPDTPVDLAVEVAPARWAPRRPEAAAPGPVVFVDGVRRVEARIWVGGDGGGPDDVEAGLCASWAAGAVRCDGDVAELGAVVVGRGLFSPSRHAHRLATTAGVYEAYGAPGATIEALTLALQERMTAAEIAVSAAGRRHDDELLVVDGPLRGRQHLAGAVGMVKGHHTAYLTGAEAAVLAALSPGERTPVFAVGTAGFVRHSWYVRLPGTASTPLAAVVRCECAATMALAPLVELADRTAVVLPRFASEPHKDPRAPQNLVPIGGLERQLRHRLGDTRLLYRSLRVAAQGTEARYSATTSSSDASAGRPSAAAR